jgi:uncharacterized membrane protein
MHPSGTYGDTVPYQPDLRVGYLFGKAWSVFKDNLLLIVGSFAIYLIIQGLLGSSDLWGGGLAALTSLLGFVIAGPLAVGFYGILLRRLRGEPAEMSNLFDGFSTFGQAFGVYVLLVLSVIVGLIFLIVPGIVIAVGLWPALFLVYDENRPVLDTLQHAWHMTRGHRLQLFVVGVAMMIVAFSGIIAFGVGIIFTGAFASLVGAAAYEEMSLAHA